MKITAFALLFLAGSFHFAEALRVGGKLGTAATAEALNKQKQMTQTKMANTFQNQATTATNNGE